LTYWYATSRWGASEPIDGKAGDAGLSRAGQPGEQRGVGGFAVCDRGEHGREVVHLVVPVTDLAGDEPVAENACVLDHVRGFTRTGLTPVG
jgi:hypothetical protein